MLEPIRPKEWASALENCKVKKILVRSSKEAGVEYITIEFSNGYVFDLISYEKNNQIVPTFWRPVKEQETQ